MIKTKPEYASYQAPCLGCTKRKVGCHAKCKDYMAWAKENERKRIRRVYQLYK